MPVPRTADFVEMGRKDAQASRARGAIVAKPYPRDSKSWQARAYWSGFDEEAERLSKSALAQDFRDPGAPPKIIATKGPLYPPKVKARSRRPGGWTAAPV